jgi:tRNA isopentenyl-2-thiomethyl-A-37 hydroxylase MiaE
MINPLLEPITNFLHCPTPQSWVDEAIKFDNLPNLLRATPTVSLGV